MGDPDRFWLSWLGPSLVLLLLKIFLIISRSIFWQWVYIMNRRLIQKRVVRTKFDIYVRRISRTKLHVLIYHSLKIGAMFSIRTKFTEESLYMTVRARFRWREALGYSTCEAPLISSSSRLEEDGSVFNQLH